ncbi:MAG: DUF5665 domain-containing protein [bacterium]
MQKNSNIKKISAEKKEAPLALKELNKNILKLDKSFENANSFKLSLVRGILSGLGATIGATIVAAIIIAILIKTVRTVRDIPMIGDLIEKTQVEKFINEQDAEKP